MFGVLQGSLARPQPPNFQQATEFLEYRRDQALALDHLAANPEVLFDTLNTFARALDPSRNLIRASDLWRKNQIVIGGTEVVKIEGKVYYRTILILPASKVTGVFSPYLQNPEWLALSPNLQLPARHFLKMAVLPAPQHLRMFNIVQDDRWTSEETDSMKSFRFHGNSFSYKTSASSGKHYTVTLTQDRNLSDSLHRFDPPKKVVYPVECTYQTRYKPYRSHTDYYELHLVLPEEASPAPRAVQARQAHEIYPHVLSKRSTF